VGGARCDLWVAELLGLGHRGALWRHTITAWLIHSPREHTAQHSPVMNGTIVGCEPSTTSSYCCCCCEWSSPATGRGLAYTTLMCIHMGCTCRSH
jgi:hypothetical protein